MFLSCRKLFCSFFVVFLSLFLFFFWSQVDFDASYYVSTRMMPSYHPEFNPELKFKMYERQIEHFRRGGVWEVPRGLSLPKSMTIKSIPRMESKEYNQHQFILGRTRFTFFTDLIVRIEWEENGEFIDDSSIVFSERKHFLEHSTEPPTVVVFEESNNGEVICLQTKTMFIRYGNLVHNEAASLLNYVNSPPLNDQTILIEIMDERVYHEGRMWRPGTNDIYNLRGTTRTLDHTNGPVPLEPGLLSRSGWSLVDDTFSPLLIDRPSDISFVKERKYKSNEVDWYFFGCGANFRQCLKDYTSIAGNIPLPPRYAFGTWWSRWWSYTDNELKELVSEFVKYKVPLDVLVIDMDWHLTSYEAMNRGALDQSGQPLGWTGYTWNNEYFPNPEEFLKWCHNEGLHVTLNLHPAGGIQPHESSYIDMAKSMNLDPNTLKFIPLNITDENFTENYFKYVIKPLEDQGIDFWWLDYQQYPFTDVLHLNPTFWLNHLFFSNMEKQKLSFNEEDSRMKRGLIFHRWGGLGSHRYQIGFSGDTTTSWETLQFQVYFTTTASNVGFTYWSHDIGGFMSKESTDPEIFARWVQWGALSPIFRTHAWRQNYLERRIWKYKYFSEMREALYLRYSLIPYIYTTARNTYDTGIGMLYPLYYNYPDVYNAYTYFNQAMFGDDILLAPVTSPMLNATNYSEIDLFVPESNIWIEWFSLTALAPGEYKRKIQIDEIPIYIKSGSIIPMFFVNPISSLMNLENNYNEDTPLILSVFPGPNANSGEYKLYEDDGESLDYQDNNSSKFTHISSKLEKDSMKWNISISPILNISRKYIIRMVGVPLPKSIFIEGNEISYKPDMKPVESLEKSIHWSLPRKQLHSSDEPYYYYDAFRMTLVIYCHELNSNFTVLTTFYENDEKELKDTLKFINSGIVQRFRNNLKLAIEQSEEYTLQNCIKSNENNENCREIKSIESLLPEYMKGEVKNIF